MHRRLVFEEPVSRAALWSRRLAWFSLAVLGLSVLVFRSGEPAVERLAPLAAAYLVVLAAFALAVLAFLRIWQTGHRGVGAAAQAFLLSGLLLLPAGYLGWQFWRLPTLADVSTDIEEPPSFGRSRVVLDARLGHVPPELAREQRAAQRRAYPKVLPVVVEVPADAAFELARRAAAAQGWQIVEAIRPGGRTGAGRIEAIARSRVLRIASDITIRVRPRADGSRIDIRSASRLGGHDLGRNARLAAAFAEEVELLVSPR